MRSTKKGCDENETFDPNVGKTNFHEGIKTGSVEDCALLFPRTGDRF
jgi:hypothetical protein